jgi:hypothetical protein
MARKTSFGISQSKKLFTKPKRTSIGSSKNSRPKNKHKKKGWKKYRGQGK